VTSRALLALGGVLSLVGVGLSATFAFDGPTFPETPLEVGGWVLLLVGVGLLRVGARS